MASDENCQKVKTFQLKIPDLVFTVNLISNYEQTLTFSQKTSSKKLDKIRFNFAQEQITRMRK